METVKDNRLAAEPPSAEFDDLRIAEDALRQRAALIDLAYEPIFIWDLDGGIVEWNAGAEILYGFTKLEAIGKRSHQLLRTVHPVALETYLGQLERDGFWSGDISQTAKDGADVVIESRQQIVESAGRRLVVEIDHDISRRKAEEGRVALLAVAGEIIRTFTEPIGLLLDMSKALGEFFAARRCLFNEIDLDRGIETVHRDYCRGVESVAGEHKLSAYSSLTFSDMVAGKTVVNSDSQIDPRTAKLYRKSYQPAGGRSYVAIPLLRDGRWVASLWLSDDEPRHWSEADVHLLEMIAERAWNAVEKLRSETALRESKERFAKAFNSSPLAITITSLATGKLVEVNDTFVRLTGYSCEEAVGRTTAELGLWKNADERDLELAQIVRDEKINNLECCFRLRDGREIVGLLSAELIEIGGEPCALTVIQDITERKRSEAVSERYRLLSEQSTDVIWLARPDGSFVDVNLAAIELYGYSCDEFLSLNVRDIRHPSQLSELPEQLDQANLGTAHFETVHVRKDGRALPVEVKANGADFGGERLVMAIIRDISERKAAEAALRESEERRHLAQEAGNVGVWDWDIEADKTYWSGTMWAFYGEEPGEVNPGDEYWSAHLHEKDRERVKLNLKGVLNSIKDRFRDEFRIVRRDGSIRWIEAVATVSRNEAGIAVRMYGVNLDITERKVAEERIRLSEDQLRMVTNELPALIYYVDSSKRYRYVNRKFSDWFGKEMDEFIGKTVRSVVGLPAYRIMEPKIDKALTGEAVTFESLIQYRTIGARYVHISYVPDIGVDGRVIGYYGLTHDLTELKHSEDLLRSSEERIGLMMESLTDYAIFSLDGQGHVDTWNKGATSIFGYSREEILGRSYEFIFTPEDVSAGVPEKEMELALQTGRAFDERWHVRQDGTRFFASGVMMPLYVGETLTGYAKIANDLTEKKRHAEELQHARDELEIRVRERTRELAESNVALVREMEEREIAEKQRTDLLRRLVNSQEFERRRIARDIHDQLGQRLTALRLKIASLREISVGHGEIELRVKRLQEISERLDSEVSFLAWELRPTALDDLGLVDAIGALVTEWSRHYDIPADFHAAPGILNERFAGDTETHLYRIIQEALNNIAKHAGAKCVNVLLERRGGDVIMIAEDDGCGFDASGVTGSGEPDGGLGLLGMRERAALIGGDLELESAPGAGTTIYVRVPAKP